MKGEDKFYGTGCSISIRRLLRRTLVRSVILLSQAFFMSDIPNNQRRIRTKIAGA